MINRVQHALPCAPIAAPELARNERGAVAVMGIFMATTLVACIWYVVGIGEAAIYRERMQDAADAAAFVPAVYHARGMNMIAMINIIMGSFMAVLVALKLIYILVLVVDMIGTALCGTGFVPACKIPPVAKNIERFLERVTPRVERTVHRLLPSLSQSQRALGLIAPWAGSFVSVSHAMSYSPPVTVGGAVSVSMVPGEATGSERIGLPLQELEFSLFCGRAGRIVSNFVNQWTPEIWQLLSGVMFGTLTSSFPMYFCGGGEMQSIELQAIAQGDKQCDLIYPPAVGGGLSGAAKNLACKAKVLKNASDLGTKVGDQYGEEEHNTPKDLFEEAQAGDDYFMVYGVVFGDTARPFSADTGVKLATLGGGGESESDQFGETLGFARAEFYFDATGTWVIYSVDALWKMRWRARLRRLRAPTPDVGQHILQHGIPRGAPGVPAKYTGVGVENLNPFHSVFFERVVRAVSAAPDVWVDHHVGGMTDDYIIH